LCVSLILAGPGDAQTVFTEVTEESGYPLFSAEGIAVGDFNNDGWPDMAQVQNWKEGKRVILLKNEGKGQFTDRTSAIRAEISPKNKGGGISFADYDNDGDLDLYVPVGHVGSRWRDRDMLLRNDQGLFTDVSVEAGLTDILTSYDVVWLDYDRDGHVDLYVGHLGIIPSVPEFRNRLYRNRGDGTFEDVTGQVGLDIQFSDGGGSVGGMASGDIDGDGWPDLYIAVLNQPNRLFLNDGQGGFLEATSSDIADPGEAWGTALGDIDNDGDLDIFQTGGGFPQSGKPFRSLMLLNIGEGQFLDVTEGVGLTGYQAKNALGAGLFDIDNDGHLDLMTAMPSLLHLNRGDGTFVDRTADSGISDVGNTLALGDFDLDGFGDAVFGTDSSLTIDPSFGSLYRNNGNDNHWLRVELVGTQSNRSGIGAKLRAASGDLTQWREIISGTGPHQHEMTAHFGLGARTQMDQLEIRWPSGQVDVLTDIPADRKIRIVEGKQDYHEVRPTVWNHSLPDSVVRGSQLELMVTVKPALFEEDARITHVNADLSELGEISGQPLTLGTKGQYELEEVLSVDAPRGQRSFSILIEQNTSLGSFWIRLVKNVVVLPDEDLGILEERVFDETAWRGQSLFNATRDPGDDSFPAWSPDGEILTFASLRTAIREIYAMAWQGGQPTNLTNFPDIDVEPTWSPDGAQIAFVSDREKELNAQDIYMMNADGSDPVNLTDHPGADASPAWSPDGAQIAFVSDRDGNREVYLMDAEGRNPVNLTNHPGEDIDPAWSPDGAKIAFASFRLGAEEIFVMDVSGKSVELDPESGTQIHAGSAALEIRAETWWTVAYRRSAPLDIVGYDALRFAFHPGDATGGKWFSATIGRSVSLMDQGKGVDLTRKEWQVVEIPFSEFGLEGDIDEITFSGDFTGTFYLDDIRLVAAKPGDDANTAVLEQRSPTLPPSFTLSQNYPNPFNAATVIRFALPTASDVDLAIFNLTGQQVAKLVEGAREAGGYTVRWDGRDDGGRELASGVYLYRLRTGDGQQVETRKLLLLR